MATGKKYYWIKLKDTFMTSDSVDFLMSQPNGANYVVLYQMLCLKTINTGGKLERHIGEIIIPYDEEKIQRDTKWFSVDTIRVALHLYQSLGLVYVDQDGALCLTDHENLVGSETDWKEQKRIQRAKKQTAVESAEMPMLPDGQGCGQECGHVHQSVHTEKEIRDKEKDKDKEIEIDIEKGEKEEKEKNILSDVLKENDEKEISVSRFRRPTVDEVAAYCAERKNGIDAQQFIDHYDANGWKVGKTPMKDWKAAVRTWEGNKKKKSSQTYSHEEIAYRAAAKLDREIRKRFPNRKAADEDTLQVWAMDIASCAEENSTTVEELAEAMEFSQNDTFWSGVILSGASFRRNYLKICANMGRGESN